MTPRSDARQTVLDSRLTVRPAARTFSYRDYWDTTVTAFDVHTPHDTLEVVADALVETSDAQPTGDGSAWAELATAAFADRWSEMLLTTPRTALDEELTELATAIRDDAPTPAAAAAAVCALVHTTIKYQPGTTSIHTDAVQVWRQRNGVCQDISHLCVGLLRAVGLPARYVSGYLYPTPHAALGEPVTGQSHAWVEWFDRAWRGHDPTNGIPIGERHIVIGRGRDYADVAPLKGVYAGPQSTGQTVAVTLTRTN